MSGGVSPVFGSSTRAPGLTFWFAVFACCCATITAAAEPEVKYLFPPGGQRGQVVKVTAQGSFDDAPVDVWVDRDGLNIQVLNDDGKEAKPSKRTRALLVVVAPDAPVGVYWLRLYNSGGASAPVPFVVGHIPEIVEQEPNDLWQKPQELPPDGPVTINGRISPRPDVDTFAVTLEAGATLVAACTANQTLDSQVDLVLQVVSTDGIVLAQNDDNIGLDPQIAFTADTAGTYLVRAFGFPANPNSSISLDGRDDYLYRMLITTGPFADFCWPLALTEGMEGNVDLVGWNLQSDDCSRAIAGPVREAVPEELLFNLANVVPLQVVAHSSIVEIEPNSREQPQSIQLPATVTGRIGTDGDENVYVFHAAAGRHYSFRLESRSMGYPLDAVLELLDTAGKSLARVDDSGGSRDAELVHTIAADGEYRIVVTDLHREGGPRYVYRLEAEEREPDFSLSVDSHHLAAKSGEALEVTVNVARSHGFADDVVVSFDGLPDGVAAGPQISVAKDDSGKLVKLTLPASCPPFAGPIRIIGRSASKEDMIRSATAPVRSRTARTPDLWLTVVKAAETAAN